MRRSVEQRLDQHDRCREAANGERQKAADLFHTSLPQMSAMWSCLGELTGSFMEARSQLDKHFIWVSMAGIGRAFQ